MNLADGTSANVGPAPPNENISTSGGLLYRSNSGYAASVRRAPAAAVTTPANTPMSSARDSQAPPPLPQAGPQEHPRRCHQPSVAAGYPRPTGRETVGTRRQQ
jgi:hypothetical protein